MTKAQIRKEMREIFLQHDEGELSLESERMCAAFFSGALYGETDLLLSYMPMRREASPLLINEACIKDKKTLALPKVASGAGGVGDGGIMDFFAVKNSGILKSQLAPGAFGILEPSSCENVLDGLGRFKKITVIVPGLAFTKDGYRLGRGKGFYDRYIKRLRLRAKECGASVTLAGFCFAFQILEELPREAHDEKMDLVLF